MIISDSSWLISAWKAKVSVSSAMMVVGSVVRDEREVR